MPFGYLMGKAISLPYSPYMRTRTLSVRLEKGPLPLLEALRIAIPVATELRAMHEQGRAYGVLSADAVVIEGDAVRLLPSADQSTDRSGFRADVFAFGALLAHMLTGTPVRGETDRAVDPTRGGGEIDRLILACLAEDGMSRPPMKRILTELRLLHIEGVRAARPSGAKGSKPAAGAPLEPTPWSRDLRGQKPATFAAARQRPPLQRYIPIGFHGDRIVSCFRAFCLLAPALMIGAWIWAQPLAMSHGADREDEVAGNIIGAGSIASSGYRADTARASRPARSSGIAGFRRRVPRSNDDIVAEVAASESLPPQLIHSVIKVESNYDPKAVSRRGAQGLMQLTPAISAQFGVMDAFDPAENVKGGAKYLRYLAGQYNGDWVRTLAAYNAGENAVARYGGVPPYDETYNYLVQVSRQLNAYLAGRRSPASRVE